MGPPAISAFDCSPIAALNLRQTHSAASWALPLRLRCPATRRAKAVDFHRHRHRHRLAFSRAGAQLLVRDPWLSTKHHLNHSLYKTDKSKTSKCSSTNYITQWHPSTDDSRGVRQRSQKFLAFVAVTSAVTVLQIVCIEQTHTVLHS